MKKDIPTLEELEDILNSGEEVPIEILPNGEVTTKPQPAERAKEEKMTTWRTVFESAYMIGEAVKLNLGENTVAIEGCSIHAVHFTASKVFYDLKYDYRDGATIFRYIDAALVEGYGSKPSEEKAEPDNAAG